MSQSHAHTSSPPPSPTLSDFDDEPALVAPRGRLHRCNARYFIDDEADDDEPYVDRYVDLEEAAAACAPQRASTPPAVPQARPASPPPALLAPDEVAPAAAAAPRARPAPSPTQRMLMSDEETEAAAVAEPVTKRARNPQPGKYARWCFTLNNPPDGFRLPDCPDVAYAISSLERGKEGTVHLQGYVRFVARKRLTQLKSLWRSPMERAHWEPTKGTEQQNKDYCSKPETHIAGPWELKPENFKAEEGKQGRRSDLEQVISACKEHKSLFTIAEESPEAFIKYPTGIKTLHQMIGRDQKPKTQPREIEVFVLWGPTSTGKTHRVRTAFPGVYNVVPGRGPWDQYEGQQEILFDEFDCEKWPIRDMNRYCDKWPCKLDCRYADNFAAWSKVFICANDPPSSWWQGEGVKPRNAFLRRITQIQKVLKRESDPDFNPAEHCFTQPVVFFPDN